MDHNVEFTDESEDQIVTNVLSRTLEALEDNPGMDELLLIASLKRVINYYTRKK
jgi:hypothetical protein